MIDLRLPKSEAWQKSEDSFQIKCAEFTKKELLRRGYSQKLFFHPPNGGNRSQREGAKLKLMGTQPGVSDIFLMIRLGGYSGFICELKNFEGTLSKDQKEFLPAMAKQGFLCVVINSLEVYKENVTAYLDQKQ